MFNRKRPAQDQIVSENQKRQLVDNLANLSLEVEGKYGPGLNKIRASELDSEYMDTSGPNTIFIPSIDEFLKEEDDGDDEVKFDSPLSILINQPTLKLPFYQKPSLALIAYEPVEVTIWRPFFKWKRNLNMEVDMAIDDDIDKGMGMNVNDIDIDEDIPDITPTEVDMNNSDLYPTTGSNSLYSSYPISNIYPPIINSNSNSITFPTPTPTPSDDFSMDID